MFDDPSHAGNPSLIFGAHAYKSKPTTANWNEINNLYTASSQFFQTGSDYTRKINLPNEALDIWRNGRFSGLGEISYSGKQRPLCGKNNFPWFK